MKFETNQKKNQRVLVGEALQRCGQMGLRRHLHSDASSKYDVCGDCLHRKDTAFTLIRIHQKWYTLFLIIQQYHVTVTWPAYMWIV